jgi:hypothetical protein
VFEERRRRLRARDQYWQGWFLGLLNRRTTTQSWHRHARRCRQRDEMCVDVDRVLISVEVFTISAYAKGVVP